MAQQVHAMAVHSRARSNPYYRAALEAAAQYVEASALRTKLLEAQQSLPGVPVVAAPQTADDNIAAWLDAVAEAQAAERAREIKSNAIRAQLIWCEKVVEDTATVQTDRILNCLHANLIEVMDHATAVVDRLDGARTPQQVIDRGVGDAWKQLRPLRNEYDKIRQAQEWAMAGEDQHVGSRSHYLLNDPLASDIILANLDDLYPEWKTKGANTFNISDAPDDDPRPWPQEPIEQIVWMCTSDAQPWVPTLSELNELNQQRTARLNPPHNTEAKHPTKQAFGPVSPRRTVHI
jgi:hypothetical protein